MSRPPFKPYAKKSLGQNFLVDPNYIQRIVSALDLKGEDIVIEIGPGRGAITAALVASEARVIAIELDRQLAPELAERFQDRPNCRVIESDATKIDFYEILGGERSKVVANLPYNISTAILQHLSEYREHFSELTLMFQKEVVDRISAPPGNSSRGFLTVLTELAFSVERLFDVPPSAFRPVPKVTSSVVRLIPKPKLLKDEGAFRELISIAFAQKRKTILNNLRIRFPNAAEILERSGVDASRRAESLTMDEWILLFGSLQ
jgi:16S rRNA (adenine1518-N6/adenine1519-N6)-dimethyltransferase